MGVRELYRQAVLRESPRLRPDPGKYRLREQISLPIKTEDWFWVRLPDNRTQKGVLPATYPEIHDQGHGGHSTKAKSPTLKLKSYDCSITLNIVFVKVLLRANWER